MHVLVATHILLHRHLLDSFYNETEWLKTSPNLEEIAKFEEEAARMIRGARMATGGDPFGDWIRARGRQLPYCRLQVTESLGFGDP